MKTMKLFKVVASIVLLNLISLTVTAQANQPQKSDSVLLVIKQYINEHNTVAIYEMGNESFRKGFDKEKLGAFFEKEIYPLGKIRQSSPIVLSQNPEKYKLQFESGKLEFSFLLDKTGKFSSFTFSPFKAVITSKSVPAATSNKLSTVLDKQVDSIARRYIQKSNTVGLSIGVLKDGQMKTYGYGETSKGSSKLPDANTIFEIGSITKTFTATILAHYINEGKISLIDPIIKYLPDSLSANSELHKITILNLSNHTSGLPTIPGNFANKMNPANPYIHYDERLLFAGLRTCKLTTAPGTVYAYSNLATGLLGVILERISGKTYEQLVKKLITVPLHMHNTSQRLTPQQNKQFVKVYDADGDEIQPWDFNALAGCGSLRSTVNDLLLYAKANIKSDYVPLSNSFTLTHKVTYSKDPVVCLGWHLFQEDGASYYWHNGGTGGSRSYLILNTEKKIAVVVLSNSNVGVDDIGISILRKII
ncbi:serine hydrolase [Pedobacter caeni]|nr:serine hydrolase [Pedobacter caeni]